MIKEIFGMRLKRSDVTVKHAMVVDNCNSPESISSAFAETYAKLYSSVPSEDEQMNRVNDQNQGKLKSFNEQFIVTPDDIIKAVQQNLANAKALVYFHPIVL